MVVTMFKLETTAQYQAMVTMVQWDATTSSYLEEILVSKKEHVPAHTGQQDLFLPTNVVRSDKIIVSPCHMQGFSRCSTR